MRRRAPDFRRPTVGVGRRRRVVSDWLWWLLALAFFTIIAFMLFLLLQHHHHHHHHHHHPIQESTSTSQQVTRKTSNFTQELLSTTSFARHLSDQLTLAKAYIIIAKEDSNLQLAWELNAQIRNCQRLLSRAAVRGKPITLEEAHPILTKLSNLIFKSQDSHYDISTIIITLKNHAQALEERARAATSQGAEFGHLAAESVPKTLHCLNIKLTEEWFKNPSLKKLSEERTSSARLVDNNLYHFCVFSDNVLATSTVINSTVSNADRPQQFVFHVVTDRINYLPMVTWLLVNDCKGCTVNVRNIEEFSWLNSSYSPLVKWLLDK